MSALFNAMNAEVTTTENGAKAYNSTLSQVLDFFYKAPVARTSDMTGQFSSALQEDRDLAVRALLWLRDVRGGAGERETFRKLLAYLVKADIEAAALVAKKLPELGRFDDLQTLFGTQLEALSAHIWLDAMREGNALAFKWAPRKDKKGAKPLRKLANMNEKTWRKFMVENSDTVEQKMCAKAFEDINFEHVPSVAMSRYGRSFKKNSKAFGAYLEALNKGEAKINAGAVFPHDIVNGVYNNPTADAQWAALPDYMEGSKYKNVLPVVDVSGSMYQPVGGGNSSVQAIDVAISLGIYCSERAKGVFKDKFITFSESPSIQSLSGSLSDRVKQIDASDWGFSTNIERVFDLILEAGVRHSVPQSEMPEVVLVPSDMQFNCMGNEHILPALGKKFEKAGYQLPKLVFWNMCYRKGGIPVNSTDYGTALVSGFSPSILKSVLSGEIDPMVVMLRTLQVERYAV